MTKGVVFFVEPETQSLWGSVAGWTDSVVNMNVDFYVMVDPYDFVPNWEDQRVESVRVKTFAEAETWITANKPTHDMIKVTTGGTELKDYTHPTDAIYVFGPDSGSYPIFTEDGIVSVIFADCWAIEYLATVLYDRFSKGG